MESVLGLTDNYKPGSKIEGSFMNCVKLMFKKHCYSEIEIEEDILVIYYYSGEEHANKDKGRTSVFPLNRHIFSQSKV